MGRNLLHAPDVTAIHACAWYHTVWIQGDVSACFIKLVLTVARVWIHDRVNAFMCRHFRKVLSKLIAKMPAHTLQSNKWHHCFINFMDKMYMQAWQLERRQANKPCQFLRHCDKRGKLNFPKFLHFMKWTRWNFRSHDDIWGRPSWWCLLSDASADISNSCSSFTYIILKCALTDVETLQTYTTVYCEQQNINDYSVWTRGVVRFI